MVGLIIGAIATAGIIVLVLFTYWKPGEDEKELGPPPEGAGL